MAGLVRFYVILLILLSKFPTLGQIEDQDSIYGIVFKPMVEITDPDFHKKYTRMVYKMKRIYPLAIHAKELFAAYEKDIAALDKKRQIKKYGKTAQEKLMEDFEYIIRDMYVSDGQLLIKLIHRETEMTVYDIIKKYRGGMHAAWYQGVGKFFEQNLKTTYAPEKEDWLIEYVAKEIEAGKHKLVPFSLMTKEEYKAKKSKQKELQKELKRKNKEREKREKSAK
jgi:hypothetical protein